MSEHALRLVAQEPAALRSQLASALQRSDDPSAAEAALSAWPRLIHALAQNGALAWPRNADAAQPLRAAS